jgi:GT2 family glycosyltransferase
VRVAVLSLTRDRLAYTKHCFDSLAKHAGCDYDHFILDQGSQDGTRKALEAFPNVVLLKHNIGISRGMNVLLEIVDGEGYDVVVKFDNDCELLTPNTLLAVSRLALEGNSLMSPRILGLQNPPPVNGSFEFMGNTILDINQIGGIFLAAPAHVYETFRYDPDNPMFGGDDVQICRWWRKSGGKCGYVAEYEANHYETTEGQQERYPDYFDRKFAEMGIA